MIRFFMPMSGNVGDTLNVMPVLSGIYKSTGHKIHLVVKDKMKFFSGVKQFLEMQDCIYKLDFESDVKLDTTYNTLSLVSNFEKHPTRPWETVRLDEHVRRNFNIEYTVDDDFIFKVDDQIFTTSKFLVGDRMYHSEMDGRRRFNTLLDSGKFPIEQCQYLDYNLPMATIASMIKHSDKILFTTFTGISTIADLLNKEMVVLWGDDLINWDDKPIEYSYNKHFYRDRKSKLIYLGDFNITDYEVTNEV